jgi:flagellar biosynthesis chaperone FliJ
MATPDSPATVREEFEQLEAQIAELQGNVDDLRGENIDPADRAAAISQAEQQEALISQLDVRRRELMEKLDIA